LTKFSVALLLAFFVQFYFPSSLTTRFLLAVDWGTNTSGDTFWVC